MITEFKSRYDQYTLATRHPLYPIISFSNGLFRTDDEDLITILREVCALESRGNRAVVEVGHLYDGPKLSGTIRLSLDGFGDFTLVVHDERLEDLMERVAEQLTMQHAQEHLKKQSSASQSPDTLSHSDPTPPAEPVSRPKAAATQGRGGGNHTPRVSSKSKAS